MLRLHAPHWFCCSWSHTAHSHRLCRQGIYRSFRPMSCHRCIYSRISSGTGPISDRTGSWSRCRLRSISSILPCMCICCWCSQRIAGRGARSGHLLSHTHLCMYTIAHSRLDYLGILPHIALSAGCNMIHMSTGAHSFDSMHMIGHSTSGLVGIEGYIVCRLNRKCIRLDMVVCRFVIHRAIYGCLHI